VVGKLNRLASHYRTVGSLIVWTRHARPPNLRILGAIVPAARAGGIDDGTEGVALHRAVDVNSDDIVLAKPQFGAFQFTGLEAILRSRNIDTIVIGGIAINFCCETTAREAHGRKFKVIFLGDATATFDLPYADGTVINRDIVQKASLATLAFGLAEVVTTDEAISRLPRSS
jgi:biuret amidohydrolase